MISVIFIIAAFILQGKRKTALNSSKKYGSRRNRQLPLKKQQLLFSRPLRRKTNRKFDFETVAGYGQGARSCRSLQHLNLAGQGILTWRYREE